MDRHSHWGLITLFGWSAQTAWDPVSNLTNFSILSRLHSFMNNNRMKLWVMFLTAVLLSIVLHFFRWKIICTVTCWFLWTFHFWNSFVGEHWMMLTFLVQPGSLSHTSFLLIHQRCKIEIDSIICSSLSWFCGKKRNIFYRANFIKFSNEIRTLKKTVKNFTPPCDSITLITSNVWTFKLTYH